MKKFSEEDKVFIKKLNEFCGDVPRSLCDFLSEKFFTDCLVIFETNEMHPRFFMKCNVYDNPKERIKKVQSFWNVLTLIPYLIQENYITIVPYCASKGNDVHLIWKYWDRNTFVNNGIKLYLQRPYYFMNGILYKDEELLMKGISFDERYGNKIKEWLGDYYPLPRLSALIENNFQTEDEIRHSENIKIAQDNLTEAKQSVEVSRASLEASKESVAISRESLEASKESVAISRASLEASKESVDVAKMSIEQAEQSIKQAKESIKYARWAIWVAIGVGILSSIVNYYLAKDKTVVIDQKQVKSHLDNQSKTINSIKTIGASLKDTFVVHIDNQLDNLDTLNVRVTNAKKGITGNDGKSVKKKE